ncbi:MAG TPA: fumarylacetoacetate hydrolase family protein [Streptosporangiaceae bacterium]|jgi:2-keto-4-pentenoate hydratase/2-oxohepta-3-ene-1,7-dioic acid hydratase in catechol pathway|nr:fumarylacetoacetate hydrolase family protein [Streptosporangiaceae bacterium]
MQLCSFEADDARDVQNWTSQWSLGESFDTFAPVGPFLVTAADVPDPRLGCLRNPVVAGPEGRSS